MGAPYYCTIDKGLAGGSTLDLSCKSSDGDSNGNGTDRGSNGSCASPNSGAATRA
jgi:hypothetical protein